MNKFEFDNMSETPRTSNKNAWLVAICLLWTSTNLAHLPWYLNRARGNVATARENAAQVNLERNNAFVEAAQAKQLAVNAQADARWTTDFTTFSAGGVNVVK